MSVVSVICIWQEGGRMYCRLTTNARWEVLARRLRARGLMDSVEGKEAFFGDRADGGSGYVIRWSKGIDANRLREGLCGL